MGSVRGHNRHGGSSGGGTAAQRSGRRDTVFQRRGLEIPRTPGSAVCPRGACCGHLQLALCLVLVGALISCSAVGSLRNLVEPGISGIHVWACTRQSGRVGRRTSEAAPDPPPVALRANPCPRLGTWGSLCPGQTDCFILDFVGFQHLTDFSLHTPPAALTELGGGEGRPFQRGSSLAQDPFSRSPSPGSAAREGALRLPDADRVEEVLPLWAGRGPMNGSLKSTAATFPAA